MERKKLTVSHNSTVIRLLNGPQQPTQTHGIFNGTACGIARETLKSITVVPFRPVIIVRHATAKLFVVLHTFIYFFNSPLDPPRYPSTTAGSCFLSELHRFAINHAESHLTQLASYSLQCIAILVIFFFRFCVDFCCSFCSVLSIILSSSSSS